LEPGLKKLNAENTGSHAMLRFLYPD
jgi:hypothetical protein